MRDIKEVEKLIFDLLEDNLPNYCYYHSVDHTRYVLNQVQTIAKHEAVVDTKSNHLLKIGALFHDVGYIVDHLNHEESSCKIVSSYQNFLGITKDDLETVIGLIMATKIPQNPKTYLECIIADADLEYFSTAHFKEIGDLLFKELNHLNSDLTPEKWNTIQIDFLENHEYHTDYCKKIKTAQKNNNLKKLKAGDFN